MGIVIKIFLRFFVFCVFAFSIACTTTTTSTKINYEERPVIEPEIIKISVIEGKTTKKEIIDVLGSPVNISPNSLNYRFHYYYNKILRLSLTQKDGTKFDITIPSNGKDNISFYTDHKNKGIITSVYVY